MSTQTLAIVIPGICTVLVAAIGAYVQISSKRRDRKATEIFEAFDERGKLVDSLKESRDEQTRKIKDQEARISSLEQERDECKRELKELRVEFEELHVMVGVPSKQVRKRPPTHTPTPGSPSPP